VRLLEAMLEHPTLYPSLFSLGPLLESRRSTPIRRRAHRLEEIALPDASLNVVRASPARLEQLSSRPSMVISDTAISY
jgi:hypothetical protein